MLLIYRGKTEGIGDLSFINLCKTNVGRRKCITSNVWGL
jgi:hypothetical protein